jgi:cytochrome c peroxidase
MMRSFPWLSLLLVLPASLAGCGSSPSTSDAATCLEGVSAEDCKQLEAIVLPAALPEARGNAHAEDFNSTLLGFHVFFDSRFSKNLNVRCESCHSVDYGFADNKPVPIAGMGKGVRNAPTIFNAARHTTFLWDGHADTLWSQPLFAFENPAEMDFTRLEIVHLLNAVYTKEYGQAFGTLPDFSDFTRFPARGAPGDPGYDAMSEDDKQLVNQVVANIGKALEAYMRKVATGPSVVDAALQKLFANPATMGVGAAGAPAVARPSTADSLSAEQQRGLAVFASSGCLQCHNGPQLSDDRFHNLGVSTTVDQTPDLGRSEAVVAGLVANPFNAGGPFFDGGPVAAVQPEPALLGGFRTPSLRNLPKSAPYGHNGSFATLEAVVDFHLQGGGQDSSTFVGTVDPLLTPVDLPATDRAALVEFLKALAGSYPALPWGQWPAGNG